MIASVTRPPALPRHITPDPNRNAERKLFDWKAVQYAASRRSHLATAAGGYAHAHSLYACSLTILFPPTRGPIGPVIDRVVVASVSPPIEVPVGPDGAP